MYRRRRRRLLPDFLGLTNLSVLADSVERVKPTGVDITDPDRHHRLSKKHLKCPHAATSAYSATRRRWHDRIPHGPQNRHPFYDINYVLLYIAQMMAFIPAYIERKRSKTRALPRIRVWKPSSPNTTRCHQIKTTFFYCDSPLDASAIRCRQIHESDGEASDPAEMEAVKEIFTAGRIAHGMKKDAAKFVGADLRHSLRTVF